MSPTKRSATSARKAKRLANRRRNGKAKAERYRIRGIFENAGRKGQSNSPEEGNDTTRIKSESTSWRAELEVKAKVIIDYLPEAGVAEKKTHSSSIDVDAAVRVRQHFRELAAAESAAEEKAVSDKAEKEAVSKRAARMEARVVVAAPPQRSVPALSSARYLLRMRPPYLLLLWL